MALAHSPEGAELQEEIVAKCIRSEFLPRKKTRNESVKEQVDEVIQL